jgi:hypothetical protein
MFNHSEWLFELHFIPVKVEARWSSGYNFASGQLFLFPFISPGGGVAMLLAGPCFYFVGCCRPNANISRQLNSQPIM